MNSWVSLLPPIIAIILAITTRQAYLSIFSGIVMGAVLLEGEVFAGITMSFDAVAVTFTSISMVKSLIFILMIGAIINILQQSGAINEAIILLTEQKKWIKSPRGAQLLTFIMGALMCLEGVGSMMMVGLVGQPLFAKHQLSKEKLAYIANSTGSPLAWLLPISGAGVFLTSLLNAQIDQGVLPGQPMSYVFNAIHYQFYTILVLLSVPVLALMKHDFPSKSPMTMTKDSVQTKDLSNSKAITVFILMLPIVILLISIFFIIVITGDGNPLKGNISDAIYWGGLYCIDRVRSSLPSSRHCF